jgi:hypothetical protein
MIASLGLVLEAPVAVVTAAPATSAAEELAAPDPAARTAAAQRLGADWEQGAVVAPLLAVVALDDDDAGVRTAAREALERLAQRGAERWRVFLDEAHRTPKAHPTFDEVGEILLRLGTKTTPTDLAAGLEGSRTDEERRDMLACFPLALRERRRQSVMDRVAIQRLLLHVANGGGKLAPDMARAGLVLEATQWLRLGTDGAPAPAPAGTSEAASWRTLVELRERVWISEVAGVALCGCGRPGLDLLERMGSVGWLDALSVQGRAAEPVAGRVAGQTAPAWGVSAWQASRAMTLHRLGRREGLLPAPPEAAEGDGPRAYAHACAVMADVDPAVVRPALTWLVEQVSARKDPVVMNSAVLALSRIGPLPPAAMSALERLAAGSPANRHAPSSLAQLALARGTKPSRETVLPIVSALTIKDEPGGLVDEALHHEVATMLPRMTATVDPVRKELEALLGSERVPLELRVALLGVLGRLPSADESTVEALRGWLASNSPRDTKPGAGADPIGEQVRLGHQATFEVAGQLAAVESLRSMGKRSAAAIPELAALLPTKNPVLEWRVRRALHALR